MQDAPGRESAALRAGGGVSSQGVQLQVCQWWLVSG